MASACLMAGSRFWTRCPRSSPLFPYTTLFRSMAASDDEVRVAATPYGVAVTIALHDLSYLAAALRADIRRSHFVNMADNQDRKSTRLNSSHPSISHAVFCSKKNTPPALLALDA